MKLTNWRNTFWVLPYSDKFYLSDNVIPSEISFCASESFGRSFMLKTSKGGIKDKTTFAFGWVMYSKMQFSDVTLNIEAPRHWTFVWGIHRWFPSPKAGHAEAISKSWSYHVRDCRQCFSYYMYVDKVWQRSTKMAILHSKDDVQCHITKYASYIIECVISSQLENYHKNLHARHI